jgi:hypothetical protein
VKLLLATDGQPPDLALALAALGHDVLLVSGTRRTAPATRLEESRAGPLRVVHVVRADLHPEHWHKSSAPAVARLWRELVARERPDVVHVQHWLRLTRELVWLGALEHVPAVVSLHDAWTSCPIATRVRPDTGQGCDAPVGPHPCVACAGLVPPRTPFVPRESQYLLLAERQLDVGRELSLARAVLAPSAAQAEACRRHLSGSAPGLEIEVLERRGSAEAWAREHLAVYQRAQAAGPPPVSAPARDWYSERMREFAQEQWDRALGATPRGALGLEPT